MRRVWPFMVLAVLVAVALHLLLIYGAGSGSSSGSEPITILRYDTVHEVDARGDALVTETITVNFPRGVARCGIFRPFDEVDPHDDRARRLPEVSTVARDGRDEPHAWDGRPRPADAAR